MINLILGDCMDLMRSKPDKFYDLAIVDHEYGIDAANMTMGSGKNKKYKKSDWDKKTPDKEYFQELFRVSTNQIIWGGNYFDLPSSQGFLIWDKKQPEDFSLAMCEFAWMSFQKPAKIYNRSVLKEKNKIHFGVYQEKPYVLCAKGVQNAFIKALST